MGRRVEDVVTPELEDFAAWLRNTYRPASQGIKACWPFHPGAALQLEALLDWWGRVEQLRLNGDGQAGPIVGQQALLWHDVLYRTLPHITQEMTSCNRRRCVEQERLEQARATWQTEERETAEMVAEARRAAAHLPVWVDPDGPGPPDAIQAGDQRAFWKEPTP
jgi:hypothetical protein